MVCSCKTTLALILASVAFIHQIHAQSYTEFTCENYGKTADVVKQCTGSGTLALGGQDTFELDLFADYLPEDGFVDFDVDIDARLTSVTGNVDLLVTSPSGLTYTSKRNVGADIVYLNRRELESGLYFFRIIGIGATSNYVLSLSVAQERFLNPMEQLVLGQVMLDCCSKDAKSCIQLKQKYPTLADTDNSTNPNFCWVHGNVCSRDGRLQEFSMPNNSMACAFPAQALASLPKLERIDLAGNRITGNISQIATALSAASNLQFLDASNNQISGNLDQACSISKNGIFQQLSLAGNLLKGSVPACLLGLKNLWEFHVDRNALTGSLPAIPNAKSSRLVHLTGANQTANGGGFNGSLPQSISDLSRLAYLDFSGNNLTGDLPRLSASIRRVTLSSNMLDNSGQPAALPTAYGLLPLLSVLNLRNNQLTGFLPAEVTQIASLKYLDVSSNQISSALPPQWSTLQALNLLKVDNNQLTGTVPGSLAGLPNLNLLDASNNQLSGTLDDYARALAQSSTTSVWRYFNISNNGMIGPMTDLSGLAKLGLFSPQSGGAYDSGSAGGQQALTLDLSGNVFTGVWPAWLLHSITSAPSKVTVKLGGSVLTCPSTAWEMKNQIPEGVLDGLTCQSTTPEGSVVQLPLSTVVKAASEDKDDELSGGAIFGIILAVLVAVGALGYVAWYLRRQSQKQKAINAASFGSNAGGLGNYHVQGRTGASGNYSSFNEDQAWSNPSSGLLATQKAQGQGPSDKQKQVGLAAMPKPQRGEF